MLCTDVVVVEITCLDHSERKHFFGAIGIGKVRTGGLTYYRAYGRGRHLSEEGVRIDIEIFEYGATDGSGVAHQAEKQVFRGDLAVPKRRRLFTCSLQSATDLIGEVVAGHMSLELWRRHATHI